MAAQRAEGYDRISGTLCQYGYVRELRRHPEIEHKKGEIEYAVKRLTDHNRVFVGTGGRHDLRLSGGSDPECL